MNRNMQNTNYYVVLTRCSTEEQRKKGASHESQLREIINHSRLEKLSLIKTYSETISGWKNVNRETLDKIYDFCLRNTNVSYLIIQKWDRFYRNSERAWYWIKRFKDISVEINAAEQWINYEAGSINTILGVYIGQAADESDNTSRRVKDRNRIWKEKGYWLNYVPLGYIINKNKLDENGKSTIQKDTNTEDCVNLIFKLLSLQTLEPHEIKKRVLKEGYQVSSSSFYRLISNIFYTGHFVLKTYKNTPERLVKGRFPAYISLKQFETNQKYLEQVKQKGGRKVMTNTVDSVELFSLKGILKCNVCDKPLTASKSQGKKKKYGYYHHNSCKVRIPSKQAEVLISNVLQSFELDAEYYETLKVYVQEELKTLTNDLRKKLTPLEAGLIKNDNRIKKLKFLLTDDDISIEEYRSIKLQIEQDREVKENEIKRIKKSLSNVNEEAKKVLNVLHNLQEIYQKVDNQYKRLILNTVFPDGFTINEIKEKGFKKYKCRTPKINKLIDILCCKSGGYKNTKAELLNVVPLRARGGNRTRTS